MMLKKITCLILICLGSISAQTFFSKIQHSPNELKKSTKAEGTYKILAVLVDFPADKDETTFGTGKFGSIYTKDYGNKILDPLPHDESYFTNHLIFAQNYYRKVSNGKVDLDYKILPGIVTVSKTMRNYSPPNNSTELTELGNFAKEVWHKADSVNGGINFNEYDIFFIFHAGVGRDVSLPGSFGNEKDLPSVYLSDKTLKKIFGENLTGLPQNKIGEHNSVVIPETESRELEGISGKVLIEISINGLIVSNIASHLGLPDLFDTNTGLSAIGRLGLMDGQSIFAYNGTFPPEPSPWEKIYLGWAEPVDASLIDGNITLTAKQVATQNDTVIFKIPINSTEYFLVENRSRDALKNGAVIRYSLAGNVQTKTFLKDTTGFYSYSLDSLDGVVLDVDEYDWAVPGNGIVIWHIDENVLNEKFESNKINVDKFRRGVDVEEADGIQDIGEEFTTIFGDEVIGEGAPEDFWFSGNKAKLYRNRFNNKSLPNSKSNTDANSLINLTDFSAIDIRMSFKLSLGDSLILFPVVKKLNLPSEQFYLSQVMESPKNSFYAFSNDSLIKFNVNGQIVNSINVSNSHYPVSYFLNSISHYYNASGSRITGYISDGTNSYTINKNIDEEITCDPVIQKLNDTEYRILIGTTKGRIHIFAPATLPNTDPVELEVITIDSTFYVRKIACNKNYFSVILNTKISDGQTSLFYDSEGKKVQVGELVDNFTLTQDNSGSYQSFLKTGKNIFIISSGVLTDQFTISGSEIEFALADIKQDGSNYIVLNNGSKIEVLNPQGSSADNFPFEDPFGKEFEGTPVIADFAGDNLPEIITHTVDGRIYAIDGGTGKLVDGFPLSAGARIVESPIIYFDADKASFPYLAVLDKQNYFYSWRLGPTFTNIIWSRKNGDNLNSSFVPAASNKNAISTFFPPERAYNWPNPVYLGTTNIRYFVSEDSKINIKIFDLAGDYVAELNDNAQGGLDNETEWNVSDIQSGVYFARIEATGSSGKSESAVIKIAVIK